MRLYLTSFFLFLTSLLLGQAQPGEYIVLLHKQEQIRQLMAELPGQWAAPELLIPQSSYFLLKTNSTSDLLPELWGQPEVKMAQRNRRLKYRQIPNDSLLGQQWQHQNTGQAGGPAGLDHNAFPAWQLAGGGDSSRLGDPIVLAIVDDGVEKTHPDLAPAIWQNQAEIPNNQIDEDQNGYVDDFWGWNSNSQNDQIQGGNHGSSVAALAAGRGNNGTGIAGLAWNSQLLILRNDFNTTEANILAAYGYVLRQRQRYNQSNGQEGAFVVACNSSWGLDHAWPSSAPLWCGFYDSLGQAGILSVAATTNNDVNVETAGDLPSLCSSDYLIVVTNLNRFGLRAGGYGALSVDLGAFGDGVFTAQNGGTYGSFGGTSAATPSVTGSIALAYAAACPNFMQWAKRWPAAAALVVKATLLQSGTPSGSLQTITTSSSYLNAGQLVQQLPCPADSCLLPPDFYLQAFDEGFYLHSPHYEDSLQVLLRTDASFPWDTLYLSSRDTLANLAHCQLHELKIYPLCGPQDSLLLQLSTTDCCLPPQSESWSLHANQERELLVHLPSNASSSALRFRPHNSGQSWQQLAAIDSLFVLPLLDSCLLFEYQLQSHCLRGDSSDWGLLHFFRSEGCPACSPQQYCNMQGLQNTFDWIERIRLGQYEQQTGNNGGYFWQDSLVLHWPIGQAIPFEVEQGDLYQESLRIWLDLNGDGDFEDADELLYQGQFNGSNLLFGQLYLPQQAQPGPSRLRIALRWNQYPELCQQHQNAETEDYCVYLTPYTSTVLSEKEALKLWPQPNSGQFQLRLPKAGTFSYTLYNLQGQVLETGAVQGPNTSLNLQNKYPAGQYFLQLGPWSSPLMLID